MPLLLKANRRIHLLATGRPFTWAGENFQCPAASRARRAKYLLGPGESKVASTTLPEASTATFKLTRTWPRMLFLADCDTWGKTRSPTSAGIVPGEAFAALAGAEATGALDCLGDETAADGVGLGGGSPAGGASWVPADRSVAVTAGEGFDSG